MLDAQLFEELRPLFTLDPLLLRTLIYLAPQQDLPVMLEMIPPYLAVTWLAHMTKDMRGFNMNEVCCPIVCLYSSETGNCMYSG